MRADAGSVRKIYVQHGFKGTLFLHKKARPHGIPVLPVAASKMMKIGRDKNTQGVMADVEDFEAQFLYSDGENYHFMNSETFDQFEVPMTGHEDAQYFMLEGESFKLTRWNEETLDIRLPPKKDLIVAEAEEAVKGDTVQGASKMVVTETGLQVKVPIFIKQGEKIRISTETKEYQERIND